MAVQAINQMFNFDQFKSAIDALAVDIEPAYSPPKVLEIAGIKVVVVDPHNEVLPFWKEHALEDRMVIGHFDRHPDMAGGAPMHQYNGSIEEFARNHVRFGSYIPVGIHLGFAGPVYSINPHEENAIIFGKVERGALYYPKTSINKNDVGEWLKIDDTQRWRDWGHAIAELKGYGGKFVPDIDLDSYVCIRDPVLEVNEKHYDLVKIMGEDRFGPSIKEALIKQAFEQQFAVDRFMESMLRQMPKPGLITIARSQTPMAFTPPGWVDVLEDAALNMIRRVYS